MANNTVTVEATTVDTTTVDTPDTTAAPAADTTESKSVTQAERKAQRSAMESILDEHGQAREANKAYTDFGFAYASQSPVANSIGAEVGIVTRDEKTNTVQRTGIGFYLRSDHLWNQRFDAAVERP
jgi:hypothetical protein